MEKNDPNTSELIYSEASALKEILEWSKTRAKWQRDALRRRIVNGSFTKNDVEELLAICLDETEKYAPLLEQHTVPEKVAGSPVSLAKISQPTGINALATDQQIGFAENGLTVVYGDNGSGKSGYVRILKDACRSRDERFEILPDINSTSKEKQSANISFRTGGIEQSIEWTPREETPSNLASISIFDSGSARTHLDREHDVAYTPFPMLVLRDLAELCDVIKTKLNNRIQQLQAQTPATILSPSINSETAAGAFLHSITSDTKKTALSQLINLTKEEDKRRKILQEDLAGDPAKIALRLNSQLTRLQALTKLIDKFGIAVSEQNFSKIAGLRKDLANNALLAKTASQHLFSKSPLPDIGGANWKTLWEAARKYSDETAYPQQVFPETSEDDKCVLCQQALSAEARDRQSSFEIFIKGTTKSDEATAQLALNNFLTEISNAQTSSSISDDIETLLKDELGEADIAIFLKQFVSAATARLINIQKGEDASLALPVKLQPDLERVIESLKKRISDLNSAAGSEQRVTLLLELKGLEDRITLKILASDIEAEIGRMKEIKKLKESIRSTAKNAVTIKNKELSDKLVTDALRSRFAREVQKLNITQMPIELRKEQDRNAQSFFRVSLVGNPKADIGKILSEGEHRCVALAAFMAELVTANDRSGIVFDDPMSSLDHLFRSRVAQRLVEEANHRQVIVFTHDLTFLFEIVKKAEDVGKDIKFQTINRRPSGPGFVEDNLPFKAQSAGQMENGIRSLLKTLKGSFTNKPQGEKSMIAQGIIAQTRIAWEQGIAEFITPVLSRFDRSVKPNSLFKLLALQESDIIAVSAARSRLSEDVHASPETLNPAETTHSQLVQELDLFRDWLFDLKRRQKQSKVPNVKV